MSPAEIERLRLALLHALVAYAPGKLRLPQLKRAAFLAGHDDATERDLAAALDYLVGKGLVESPAKLLSPENTQWKATAAGVDYAAANPFA